MKKEYVHLPDHEVDQAGKRLRPFLDKAAADAAPSVSANLAAARAAAVARVAALEAERSAASTVVANGSTLALNGGGLRERISDWRFWATGIVVAGLVASYAFSQYRESNVAREAAEVELMILGDDVPVDALLDKGFSSYLREENK
jgi:hypothetical protein